MKGKANLMTHLNSEATSSLRAFTRVVQRLLPVLVLLIICQSASSQIDSIGGGNPFNAGFKPGRLTNGGAGSPAAFSGVEQPDIGSFLMSEPLLSLAGRGGLDVNLDLNYDSNLYQVRKEGDGLHVRAVRGDGNGEYYSYLDPIKGTPAYGFTLGFGALIRYARRMECSVEYIPPIPGCIGTIEPGPPEPPLTTSVFIDPTAGRGGSGDTRSGMEGNIPTITYPDGKKILFGLEILLAGGKYSTQEWFCAANGIGRRNCYLYHSIHYPTKIIDRNGNYIVINYLVNSGHPNNYGGPHISSVIDTLGREIKFNYDSLGNRLLSITVPGFQPNTEREVARFAYGAMNRVHYFYNQESYTESVYILRNVFFPATRTGVRYTYSSYGMIYKVERLRGMDVAPDGTVSGTVVATTEYDYPTSPQNLGLNVPKYTKRSDWWLENGSPVDHTFTVTRPAAFTSLTSIAAPDGSVTETKRRSYSPHEVNPADTWDDRLVQEVKLIKGGIEFSKQTYQWLKTKWGARITEQTTIVDGSPPKKTTYQYNEIGCSSNCEVHSQPTVIREFGFDGIELRRTETVYKTPASDPQYFSRWIINLPITKKTFNSVTNQLEAQTNYEYDTNSSLTSYSNIPNYQDPLTPIRGNLTVTSANTNAANPTLGIAISTSQEYDTVGNVVSTTDPNGNVSYVEYSAEYRRAFPTATASTIPDSNPNDGVSGSTIPLTTSSSYNLNTGLLTSSTNANSQMTSFEYDAALRPKRTVPPSGGSEVITEYSDDPGNVFVKVRKQIDGTVWEEGFRYFDSLGRVTKTQTSDAIGSNFIETIFDDMGRVTKTSNPYRLGEEKHWVETAYDALARPEHVTSPKIAGEAVAARLTSEYSSHQLGQVQIGINQAGAKGRSIINALGELVRLDEPNNFNELGSIDSPLQYTEYKYDASGRLRKVTQGGQSRYFLYDSLGRLLRIRQPEQDTNPDLIITDPVTGNSQWSVGFTYDKNGNILSTTDAKGVTTNFLYDNLNRVVLRSYSVPQTTDPKKITLATPAVSFKYDGVLSPTAGNPNPPVVPLAKGVLTEVMNSVSATRFTNFDNQGRIKASEQITDGQVYGSSYEYNLAGALTSQVYPSGRVVTNGFDTSGDPASVTSNLPGQTPRSYVSNVRYSPTGSIEQLQLGNGRWETLKFNARNQITQIGIGTSPTEANLWKVEYDYGRLNPDGTIDVSKNDGNVIRQSITVPGITPFVQNYSYDPLNRLSEAKETTAGTQNWKQTFGYDRYGNRTGFSYFIGQTPISMDIITHPGVDPVTNRFQATQGYEYDYNGNLIRDVTGREFSFDADNKQGEYRNSGNLLGTYSYDGNGRRVKKTVAGNPETTIFVYDVSGRLLAEYSDTPRAGGTSFVTPDILNSPRVITDSAGDVTSRRDFLPFGEALLFSRSIDQKYGVDDGLRKSFTGYERDNETQLDFAEARYYNSAHARFTTVDPLLASGISSNPQTFNRYVYAGNNPTLRVDPNGEDWYVHWRDKLEGGGSARILTFKWHSGNKIGTRARNFIVNFTDGPVRGLVVLDKWENRYKKVASMQEALAQFEEYRRQAALNYLVGALEATSFAVEVTGAMSGTGVDRDSESYKLGWNNGTINSGVSTIAGGALNLSLKGLRKLAKSLGKEVRVSGRVAQWAPGIQPYAKGDMTAIEHVFYRHGPSSGFNNVSKFSQGTSLRDVANMVDEAWVLGTRNGDEITYDFGRVIGTDPSGNPATRLRIYLNQESQVRSAFPY